MSLVVSVIIYSGGVTDCSGNVLSDQDVDYMSGVDACFAIPAMITQWLLSVKWVSKVHWGYVDSCK